jgi:hypothetical protein
MVKRENDEKVKEASPSPSKGGELAECCKGFFLLLCCV